MNNMDMRKTVREIGLFETAVNLVQVRDSADVMQEVGDSMPLPNADIEERMDNIAKWLLGFGKNKYMFFTPEIAIAEQMAKEANSDIEIIISIPCDMDIEAKDRLKNNLPRGTTVTVLEEPYFPTGFFPRNGMMVVCGYSAGDRAMILSDTYRMVEHYSGFLGKKVFVPYVELSSALRYDGWMEVNQQRLSMKWRIVS